MYDLVIRGATIVDGTGRPSFSGDVAVDGEVISAVGTVDGRGSREIDAQGLLLTPGFVDIHTHYDGQATWDSVLAPSSNHGVTSIVMGNCGVGFAPAAPDKHDFLISLMEGVEDIPGTALAEGLTWEWETLPQYLDALDRMPHSVDLGSMVPHAALRAYVMGERGANHEEDPTPDEIESMYRQTKEALRAGALGFASSRTLNHRSRTGQNIGSLTASTEELLGIARALTETSSGVFQMISDFQDFDYEWGLMRRIASETGRPLSFTLHTKHGWERILDCLREAASDGLTMKAQVAQRPTGVLLGLDATVNPFMRTPAYRAIAHLPLAERVAEMSRQEVRLRILEELSTERANKSVASEVSRALDRVFPLSDPPNYEPGPEDSIAAAAAREGRTPAEVIYDLMLSDGGRGLLYFPLNDYPGLSLDILRELMTSPSTVFGLSDGGAHVGAICDASFVTYNLTHWTRDRSRGERLPLEVVVKRQTRDTAAHVGWHDRGVVAPGYKADLNVIDYDRLQLRRPYVVRDLPAGGRRILQDADGYRYTIKSGQVTFEDGKFTGALPGELVRGARAAISS